MQGRFRPFPVAALLAAALLLAACGGGGGSAPSGLTPGGSGGAGSNGNGSGGSGTTSTAHAPASLTISFLQYQPINTAGARRAQFISPATQSIKLGVVENNGTTIASPAYTTIAVGPTAANCTASGAQITCTASIDAPVGNDVVSVTTYDQSFAPLGTSLVPITIVQNSTNRVPLAVGGTIANLELYLDRPVFATGTAAKSTVIIVPFDSSGAIIVNPGNYNPAISVSATPASGPFSLILDGAASGYAATVASPNDQVVLSYDGTGSGTISTQITASAGSASASVTASASGVTVPPLSANGLGPNYVVGTSGFIFSATGLTGTLSIASGTPPYTVTSSNPSVATVLSSAPYTVTAVGSGTATIVVTDSASPVHATVSIPVTVQAPPITITVQSCGAAATCGNTKVSFPPYGSTGVTPQEAVTIALGGGTGTYAFYFASSGTATSQFAKLAAIGNAYTITPTGNGNDTLIFSSGGQYAAYGILTATTSPLTALLPKAFGMFVVQNSGGVGKSFSFTAPASVSGVVQTSGATDNSFLFNGAVVTALPMTPGLGAFQFTDGSGNVASVPFTVFGLTFGTYFGTGSSSNTETATPADEQFTGIGETDSVTVTGATGTLTLTSSNPNIVSVPSSANSPFTVTSVGAGTATVTMTDTTGASISYTVSVTTTTVPITGKARSK